MTSVTILTIDNEGCKSIARGLLKNKNSNLQTLVLINTGIDDSKALKIAAALRQNTTLISLHLNENSFGERGLLAFLKLLNDVSSIEKTYMMRSNHTVCEIIGNVDDPNSFGNFDAHSADNPNREIKNCINEALLINRRYDRSPHAAGGAKVIATHLDDTKRSELCRLQGINYSYSSMFRGINLVLANSGEDGKRDLSGILATTLPSLCSSAMEG